jgi:hypothetical protein
MPRYQEVREVKVTDKRSPRFRRKGKLPNGGGGLEVQVLIERYRCPVPFHAVRTRFLGNIASPSVGIALDTVKALWGGELPKFDAHGSTHHL